MRRFELTDQKSAKFWSISRSGSTLSLAWGRLGTAGQAKAKDFKTEAEAIREAERLVAEKTGKGYIEIGGLGKGKTSKAKDAAKGKRETAPRPASQAGEDEIVLTDLVRKHMIYRRGGRVAPPPVTVDALKALKKVAQGILARTEYKPKNLVAPVLQRMGEAAASKRALEVAGVDIEARTLAMALPRKGQSTGPELIDYLVVQAGVVLATEVVRLSCSYSLQPNYDNQKAQLSRARCEAPERFGSLKRLRHHLALATEREYAAAMAGMDAWESPNDAVRAILFPERRDWCDLALGQLAAVPYGFKGHALAIASNARQLDNLKAFQPYDMLGGNEHCLAALVDSVGPAAVPYLEHLVTVAEAADWQRELAAVLACIPSDEATALLVRRADDERFAPALREVMDRWPNRSFRCLAGASGKAAKDLLAIHLRVHPEVAHAAVGAAERRVVDALATAKPPAAPVAKDRELPRVLVNPPWASGKPLPPPRTAEVKPLAYPTTLAFAKGEDRPFQPKQGGLINRCPSTIIAYAAEPRARKMLAGWNVKHGADFHLKTTVPEILRRFREDALPKLEALAEAQPAKMLGSLMPVRSLRLARAAVAMLGKKSTRDLAGAYFLRHPEVAALALIPIAVGSTKQRALAERGLLLLEQNGHGEVARRVAQRYGAEARDIVEELFARDPLDNCPRQPPKLPDSLPIASLEPPALKNGRILDFQATKRLVEMLAFSTLEEPYAGLQVVRQACDGASLGRFAWSLFTQWLGTGASAKDDWMFGALGLVGDDECVRRLTPMLRRWPGEAAHARAVKGLEVLAAVGSDVALMALNGIALKLKFKGLQEQARDKIQELAAERGLTNEELEDRIVPDLGLDEDGSLTLDFGARQFRVGFDEMLVPFVLDAQNKCLGQLPKPGKQDQAETAARAVSRWKALKADARALAGQQVLRLELAMCRQRRWNGNTFATLLVHHPLMFHLSRRLVWGVFRANALRATFRVAEDRTLADVKDNAVTLARLLAPGDQVGLPHALQLPDGLGASWSKVLADYEIIQPFEQLGRGVYRPTAKELKAKALLRVEGRRVPSTRVLKLEQRGWRKGEPQDGGCIVWFDKPLSDGRVARLELDPGVFAGGAAGKSEQTLGKVVVVDASSFHTHSPHPLSKLGMIAFSELVRDLLALQEG